jgi:polysaccharide deacetylase family protein (PEP-CTERM system associated)
MGKPTAVSNSTNPRNGNSAHPIGALTVDVEDWYHILDTPAAPSVEQWGSLESRVEQNMERLLDLLRGQNVRATLFWLGWVAERHRDLLRKCVQEGHEIASHGYAHVLAHQAGPKNFREDIRRGKMVLEDIIGHAVKGFRAPGFSIMDDTLWAFDEIREAGYTYDSSVFPLSHGHGGMQNSPLGCYTIKTTAGDLIEFPMSAVEILGQRINMFGGGYLRLFPWTLIRWGIGKVHNAGHPVIVYVHPREIDPNHPRLPLSLVRRFKSYVGLKSTYTKLVCLCQELEFCTMTDLAERPHDKNQACVDLNQALPQ